MVLVYVLTQATPKKYATDAADKNNAVNANIRRSGVYSCVGFVAFVPSVACVALNAGASFREGDWMSLWTLQGFFHVNRAFETVLLFTRTIHYID